MVRGEAQAYKFDSLTFKPIIGIVVAMLISLCVALYFQSTIATSLIAVLCLSSAGLMIGVAARFAHDQRKTFDPRESVNHKEDGSWKLARGRGDAYLRLPDGKGERLAIRKRKITGIRLLDYFKK